MNTKQSYNEAEIKRKCRLRPYLMSMVESELNQVRADRTPIVKRKQSNNQLNLIE